MKSIFIHSTRLPLRLIPECATAFANFTDFDDSVDLVPRATVHKLSHEIGISVRVTTDEV